METNRRLRYRGGVVSLLVVFASFCAVSMTHAAPRPTMKELLATQGLQKPKAPFPLPVRIASVTVTKEAGRKGNLNNRWHSDDAFRGTYAQEFYDGLGFYLKGRGFKLNSSKGVVVARVYIDRFTGRKGSDEYGGDLKGTLVLRLNGKEIGRQPLSESVNYVDTKEERRAFAKEFSQEKVNFSTVLFYNLTVGFYDSIAQSILDARPDEADLGTTPAIVHQASAPAREAAPSVIAQTAPPARDSAVPMIQTPPPVAAPAVAVYAAPPQPQPVLQSPPAQPTPQAQAQEVQPPPAPTQQAPPPAPAHPKPRKAGILSIESDPNDAEIYLDSKLLATTPVRRLRLAAGDHSIMIRKAGYEDWAREITVLEDADVTIKATLESNRPKVEDQGEPKEEPGIPKQEEPEEENLNE
jgi:hypothetical protein